MGKVAAGGSDLTEGAQAGGGQWGCAPKNLRTMGGGVASALVGHQGGEAGPCRAPGTMRSCTGFRGDKQRLRPHLGSSLRPFFVLRGRTTWACPVTCVRSHPQSLFQFLLASAHAKLCAGEGLCWPSAESPGAGMTGSTSLSAGTWGAPSRPLQWGRSQPVESLGGGL